jgi:hypothetical protein
MFLYRPLALVLMCLTLGLPFSSSAQAADIELGKALKEIFIKGSLDDDKLFMVLGMERAREIFGQAIQNAVDIEELKDWGRDSAAMLATQGRRTWNRNHDGDVVDHLGQAAQLSMETADDIYKWPWRSLKKIPNAFKVGMNDAREARANANNSVSGTLAFSGLAAWTSVKGAYYLVVEAPVTFVAALATTALAVPATLAYEAIRLPIALTIAATGKVIRLGYMASKAIVMGAVAVGTIAYSALSTGVAMAATTIAAAAVGAFRLTIKLVKLPFKFFKRGLVKTATTINYRQLSEFADSLPQLISPNILKKLGVNPDFTVAETRFEDHKAVIKLASNLRDDKDALVIRLGIDFNQDKEQQFLTIESYLLGSHFRALKAETGLKTRELRTVVENNLATMIGNALLIFQMGDQQEEQQQEQETIASELAMAI